MTQIGSLLSAPSAPSAVIFCFIVSLPYWFSVQNSGDNFGFTPLELRKLRALRTPIGIQRYLDGIPYHLPISSRSPRLVLRTGTAHCLEGATFAAAALRVLGFPPLILDLEADHDTDHVIAVFKMRGHWGALAKSNFVGCRYREPIYRTLRELALSYFPIYFNLRGDRTLRRYSRPVNLTRFDHLDWMTSEKPIWFIAEHLCEVPHRALLTPAMEKNLTRVDVRTMQSEMVGHLTKASSRAIAPSREAGKEPLPNAGDKIESRRRRFDPAGKA